MERKVALVTGSSRGIGFAIATRLLIEDFTVLFNGVSAPDLAPDKQEIIEGIQKDNNSIFGYVQADVSTVEGRQALLDFIDHETKRIDVLVNNAGIAPRERKDLLDITIDEYRDVMTVNLEGPFFLTQAVARRMLELKTENQIPAYNPCIINISSISAYTASVNRAVYCISKAGVSMMTSLFASSLGDKVSVHEIRPGIIETDMTAAVMEKYKTLIAEGLLPINHIGSPEDVAEAVVAIVNGSFPYSTGNIIDVDGGFHLRRL